MRRAILRGLAPLSLAWLESAPVVQAQPRKTANLYLVILAFAALAAVVYMALR